MGCAQVTLDGGMKYEGTGSKWGERRETECLERSRKRKRVQDESEKNAGVEGESEEAAKAPIKWEGTSVGGKLLTFATLS